MALNEQQMQVVNHREGNLIVAAVAGAGKTTAVVNLIAGLIKEGTNPKRILAATFSKKAAGEMDERLEKLSPKSGARIGTLHSVCFEIIRDGSPWAKYELATDGWVKTAVKIIIGYQDMDWKTTTPDDVLQYIAKCKAVLWDTDEKEAIDGEDKRFQEAYRKFDAVLERERKITFDDMVGLAYRWLNDSSNRDGRARWANKYDWVIVDEFQDTNAAAYEVVKMLAANAKLVVVGDDDQNIFQWRFTDPSFFTNFEQNHQAKVIRMESNYRCGKKIGHHANELIQFNQERIVKVLRPERPTDGSLVVKALPDMDAEANFIVDEIQKIAADGTPLENIVVLYRTGMQSQPIAMELLTRGIPHIVIGGGNFFKRKEIKALVSYLRAAMEPKDIESWHSIINVPFRYLGNAFVRDWDLASKGITHEEGLRKMHVNARGAKQRASVSEVLRVVATVRKMFNESKSAAEALRYVIDEIGLEEFLTKDEGKGSGEEDRMAYVWRLVDIGDKFPKITSFLDIVKEAERPVERNEEGRIVGKVQLMSIHRSKGLEFNHVFVAGACQGILPHRMAERIEEERRLCYVAMTRAKDFLYMTYPLDGLNGRVGGPSEFLIEAGLIAEEDDPNVCPELEDGQYHLFLAAGKKDVPRCKHCDMTRAEAGAEVYKKKASEVKVVAESGPAPIKNRKPKKSPFITASPDAAKLPDIDVRLEDLFPKNPDKITDPEVYHKHVVSTSNDTAEDVRKLKELLNRAIDPNEDVPF